jgi:hypothetical protein
MNNYENGNGKTAGNIDGTKTTGVKETKEGGKDR